MQHLSSLGGAPTKARPFRHWSRIPAVGGVPVQKNPGPEAKVLVKHVKPKLLINNEFVDAASGKTFPVVDPRNEAELLRVAEADAEDVDRAVKAARKAADEGPWPRMTAKARGRLLHKLADLLEENSEELAQLETLDSGLPVSMSSGAMIPGVIDTFRYHAGWADKIHGKTISCDGPYWAHTLREPLGVVGQIIPWNFPLPMAAWKLAPALATGNAVVLKVAEQTPMTALRLGELAMEAGFPEGVINILAGYGPTAGGALVAHQGIDKIAFTGSTEVGRMIGKVAGQRVIPCSMELGGKSAIIVCGDVDLDTAAAVSHMAVFVHQGQCCTAGSRVFVHQSVYDKFVEKSVHLAQQRRVGDPFTDVDQGPQVDQNQFNKIMGYIQSGCQEGATLACGGQRIGSRGYYIEPTVFVNVKDDMKISRDEIFGPVQSIFKFKTLDEVIHRANDSPYGLAAGVFSNNLNTVNMLSRALKAGTIWVNCYHLYDPAVPFGGYKESGIGREQGENVLGMYTQIKAIYQPLFPTDIDQVQAQD